MTVAKKIISTLLVAAVAVGIGLVLALLLPQGEYPPPEPTHTEMADTTIHTGRLPGYENAPQNTTPEYFWYLFNGSLAMGKDGSLPLLLENTPGNECVMRVRYTLADGTVLLTTPIIRAGEYLLYAYPDSLPEAGSYPVTVSILVFHAQQDPATDEPFATYTEQATLTVPQGAALSVKTTVNKKEKRLAIKSILSSKVLENELVVVDSLDLKEIKTSKMAKALTNLKVEGKSLIVLPEKNENVQKSARNIEGVKTSLVNTINVYDLLKYKNLIFTLDTVKKLEEVYA